MNEKTKRILKWSSITAILLIALGATAYVFLQNNTNTSGPPLTLPDNPYTNPSDIPDSFAPPEMPNQPEPVLHKTPTEDPQSDTITPPAPLDTKDPDPNTASTPAAPTNPPADDPAPTPAAALTTRLDELNVNCPDCTPVEHILLDLAYLNQLLTMLDQIKENASKLPPGFSPIIVDIIKSQHPTLAPLIPASLKDNNKDNNDKIDKDMVVSLIHQEINRSGQQQTQKKTPKQATINDIKVVFARPGQSEKNIPPRVHVNIFDERQILTPSRPLTQYGLNIKLLEIIPSANPRRERPRIIILNTRTGNTQDLTWIH